MSNPPSVVVRDTRPDEFDAVGSLIRAAYAEYAPAMPEGRWERYMQNATDLPGRLEDAVLIVAELDNRLVGTITYYPDGALPTSGAWPKGWVGLRLLGVHPHVRGLGIGHALMQECIGRARAQGATAVGLHTTELMAVARAMYERMGFVRAPEHDYRTGAGNVVPAYRFDLKPS
jgi:GNAT superfamily N-acetyltransferase